MPIRDWIPDPVERWWDRGVADPLQFIDSVTPGDWRQDNRFNTAGAVAGLGQVVLGVPAALSQGVISGLIGGGSRNPVLNAGLGPTGARPTTGGNGFLQGGFGGGSAGRDPSWRMGGVRDWVHGASGAARAATDARNAEIAAQAGATESNIDDFRNGGGSGETQGRSTAHVTGGDVSLSEHIRAQFNRGGTQAER